MALIDEVKKICRRLALDGWSELLTKHGLDITKDDLDTELGRKLEKEINGNTETTINRNVKGFEDFSLEGHRGIEPGYPSRSLLFHAFASPNVIFDNNEIELRAFPTLSEIEIVENYIYAMKNYSLPESQDELKELSIVVFATEYRPGTETVHKKHADMCYSRTGIARTGTAEPLYDPKSRGFSSFVENNPHKIRVLPSRYSVYLSKLAEGNTAAENVMRFNAGDSDDSTNDFWIPIHKLFDGDECIIGMELTIILEAHHINDKIKRVHKELSITSNTVTNYKTGDDLEKYPLTIKDDEIAKLVVDGIHGKYLLSPKDHYLLIERAEFEGNRLTYWVPANADVLHSAVTINDRGPEYVHARHKTTHPNPPESEGYVDLNNDLNADGEVDSGNYNALNYVDFSGDGWIQATCQELEQKNISKKPAYSLVTAPDFFPFITQRALLEWWEKLDPTIKSRIWISRPGAPSFTRPDILSDTRSPANLQITNAPFSNSDNTITAIVSMNFDGVLQQTKLENVSLSSRHSHLPDNAAGLFAPGWDVGFDEKEGITHLAAHKLGSPFPEDAKLCAALSAFWPAVAPDVSRTFEPVGWPTVCPLTDDEIGMSGNLGWDGFRGPRLNGNKLQYDAFDNTDYIKTSLDDNFFLSKISTISLNEYTNRIHAMARVYMAKDIPANSRGGWVVVSFNKISSDDAELNSAQNQIIPKIVLQDSIYKFKLARILTGRDDRVYERLDNKVVVSIDVDDFTEFFVDAEYVLMKEINENWKQVTLNL